MSQQDVSIVTLYLLWDHDQAGLLVTANELVFDVQSSVFGFADLLGSVDDVAVPACFLITEDTELSLFDDGLGEELVSDQIDNEDP